MDELKLSTEKLDAALARLERVLDGVLNKAGDPAATSREVEALIADRSQLAEDLDAALAREKELQALADEASEALGAAISEVRAALNRQGETAGETSVEG